MYLPWQMYMYGCGKMRCSQPFQCIPVCDLLPTRLWVWLSTCNLTSKQLIEIHVYIVLHIEQVYQVKPISVTQWMLRTGVELSSHSRLDHRCTLEPRVPQLLNCQMQSHLSWLVVSPLWQNSNSSGKLVLAGVKSICENYAC